MLLNPAVRASQSFWTLQPEGMERRIVERLAADLDSGHWDEHGHLRDMAPTTAPCAW